MPYSIFIIWPSALFCVQFTGANNDENEHFNDIILQFLSKIRIGVNECVSVACCLEIFNVRCSFSQFAVSLTIVYIESAGV